VVLAVVVGGAVLVSSSVGLYLAYQGTRGRYDRVQRQRVAQAQRGAAAPLTGEMSDGLREFRSELRDADAPSDPHPSPAQRAGAYAAATTPPGVALFDQIAYVSPSGAQLARAAGGEVRAPRAEPLGRDPLVRAARARGIALGPAYALGTGADRRLKAEMAVTEARPSRGVILARLNLDFVPLLIGSFPNTSDDVVWMVDGRGRLVARSDSLQDISLRDVSGLPQVRAALAAGEAPRPDDEEAVRGRDLAGKSVLATSIPLPLQRWYLIAMRTPPPSQGPLTSAIVGIAISLVVFLGLAVLASFMLARRMTRPILEIQRGAAAIADGRLQDRIEVRTGDELESLAEEFNGMAARLHESYETLEQRVEDRTRDLVEVLDRLRQASTEKTRFLATMSHELRTPLNAIINFADVLRDASSGTLSSRQAAYAEDIHQAGRHLLELINDSLDLARIEAGRIEIETESLHVEPFLRDSLRVVREEATRKGIRLLLEVDPEVTTVEADERKLRQVLFNLLANAIRFTDRDGTVALRTRADSETLHIAVADSGVGIAVADQGRIFGEFEQAGTPEDRRGGTGLGLALAKRLVELHGGRLALESAPGKGSTFTVLLPLTPSEAPSEPNPPATALSEAT
jgi:signal transduction histidine kinase